MRKGIILSVLALVAGLSAFGSGSTPGPKRFARFVIPVQQQPEFAGMETNVLTFTTWETNGTEHVYSATNTAPVINTNTFTFCDFELFAIDQTNPTNPVFYATSIGAAEWENYPDLKGLNWSSLELQ
jgi:hypothetical protein